MRKDTAESRMKKKKNYAQLERENTGIKTYLYSQEGERKNEVNGRQKERKK